MPLAIDRLLQKAVAVGDEVSRAPLQHVAIA
jgi:hypothetical protein